MRTVIIRRFGEPDGMEVVDAPEPSPGPGRVAIRTQAIGVGGVDAVIRRGTIGALAGTGTEPIVPGSEIAGIVSSVGEGVDPAWLGRRVWAFTGTSGGYAEVAIAAVDDIVALPEALAATDAVTLGSAAPVAHFALEHVHLTAGERLLVRGAAGSIGIAAIELAQDAGASAIAVTTSSAERGSRLRALGATHVLDRSGRGDAGAPAAYDVVLDIVGGAGLPAALELLAPEGRLVSVGMVAGWPPADFGTTLLRAFQRSLSYSTFSLATVPRDALADYRRATFERAASRRLHAVVHDILPLERAVEAHRAMDAGSVLGRIVLVP